MRHLLFVIIALSLGILRSEAQERGTSKDLVKISAEIGKDTDDPVFILYNLYRPLKIADFHGVQGGTDDNIAASYVGIGMKYSSESMNGQVTIKVSISANFDKTRSWCKEAGRDANTLAHEQIHFDISALKACELLEKIRKFSFSPANYEKELDRLQDQAQKEMEQVENDYDRETRHGTIATEQVKWRNDIKKQLETQACYTNP